MIFKIYYILSDNKQCYIHDWENAMGDLLHHTEILKALALLWCAKSPKQNPT